MKEVKVKLNEIVDALEFVNYGMDSSAYFNPETKEISYIDDFGGDMTEEEKEDIYENSIELPTKYEIDEYGIMTDFIETIENVKLYNKLIIAVNGKGAFRRFYNVCINYKVEKDWYDFRDKRYKKIARDWCKKYNIDFEE